MSKRISDDEMIVDPLVYETLSSRVHDLNGTIATLRNEMLLMQLGKREISLDRLQKILCDGVDKTNRNSKEIVDDYKEARESGVFYYKVSMKNFHARRRLQYPNINWAEIEKQDIEDAEKRRSK